MYSPQDLSTVHSFLKGTNEGNLRKMLISPILTEAHFKILLKIARGCAENEFIDHVNNGTFPKVKLSAPEIALKEAFWPIALSSLESVGLLSKEAKKAA